MAYYIMVPKQIAINSAPVCGRFVWVATCTEEIVQGVILRGRIRNDKKGGRYEITALEIVESFLKVYF